MEKSGPAARNPYDKKRFPDLNVPIPSKQNIIKEKADPVYYLEQKKDRQEQ
jgi:hypothetical protein